MKDVKELVAELRECALENAKAAWRHDHPDCGIASNLAEKAADAIEALSADAERWREHIEVWGSARIPGALYVRLTMQPEASGAGQAWHTEYVFDTHALGQRTALGLKAIGMSVEQKAKELFAAIDEAKK